MVQGLKQHSHAERSRIVKALVPAIQRHIGKDLLALAATGSFARGTDALYSDVELIGIVRKPREDGGAIKFIHDGLLIDMWFLTEWDYLKDHRLKVRPSWPYASASVLVPILNAPLIEAINRTARAEGEDERFAAIVKSWPDFQEWSAKVLTAAHGQETTAIPYLYWQMVEKACALLSLLNGRPFITRATAFGEAHGFEKLPENFRALFAPGAAYASPAEVAAIVTALFENMERMLLDAGIALYAPSLDAFVVTESIGARLWRRLGLKRITGKARKTGRKLREKFQLPARA